MSIARALFVCVLVLAFTACDDGKSATNSDTCASGDCVDTDQTCVGAGCDVAEDCVGAGCGGPTCEAPGQCEGATFVVCVNGQETESQDCSLLGAGAYCSADGCVASCTTGELVCQGGVGGHPFECQATGLVQVATCAPEQYCSAGACVADVCVQGTTTCVGGQPYACDANGTASTQSDTCTSTEECQAGTCVAVVAPPSGACTALSEAIVAATGPTITLSPAAPGFVDHNGTTTTLRSVIQDAAAGTTILLEDGEYTFEESDGSTYTGLYFMTANLTLRSVSGNPDAVVLDSNYADHGGETGLITVAASNITIADLTLKRSIFHLVHIWNGGDDVHLHDVHFIDGGEQFVKTSPEPRDRRERDLFELPDDARGPPKHLGLRCRRRGRPLLHWRHRHPRHGRLGRQRQQLRRHLL